MSIASLAETITQLQSTITKPPEQSVANQSDQPAVKLVSSTKSLQGNPLQDRRYNVVIYGIEECPGGLPRHVRSGLDLTSVTELITKVDENINPLSIRDIHRLGKYQEKPNRPRPILTKFNRAIDVSLLLSKTSSLPKGIRVKPDMSPAERETENLLLKERRALINDGQGRREGGFRKPPKISLSDKTECSVQLRIG